MQKKIPDAAKIVITGFPSMENGVKALDEGADAYLVKPLKPEELIAIIDEKLKEHRRTAESHWNLQNPKLLRKQHN
jgi:DNA-binding response OmpR family regulator